jgi:hypothetical protein
LFAFLNDSPLVFLAPRISKFIDQVSYIRIGQGAHQYTTGVREFFEDFGVGHLIPFAVESFRIAISSAAALVMP